MDIKFIPAFNRQRVNVIIETPKGSRIKYAYDTDLKIIRAKKELPQGFSFPFDFGFIPHTRGGDGDPLDVLVFMDTVTFPGCLIECRVVGSIQAIQKEKRKSIKNDRLLAVPAEMKAYDNITSLKDLDVQLIQQVEKFFIAYNEQEDKTFVPVKRTGPKAALNLIRKNSWK